MTNLVRSYLIVTDGETVGYEDLPTFLPASAWNALQPIIDLSQKRFDLGELAVDGQLVLPHGHDFVINDDDFEEGFVVETWLPEWDSSSHHSQCFQNQVDPLVDLTSGFVDLGNEDVFVKAYAGGTEHQLFPGAYPYHLVVTECSMYMDLSQFGMRVRLAAFNGGKDMVINKMSSQILSINSVPAAPPMPEAPVPKSGGVYKNAPRFQAPQPSPQYNHDHSGPLDPAGAHSMSLGSPPRPGDHTHNINLSEAGAHSNTLGQPPQQGDHVHSFAPKAGWDYKSQNVGQGKSVTVEKPEEEGSLFDRLRGVTAVKPPETPEEKAGKEEAERKIQASKKMLGNMFPF